MEHRQNLAFIWKGVLRLEFEGPEIFFVASQSHLALGIKTRYFPTKVPANR